MRYMGNKRALAADLSAIIRAEAGGGRVADLFAGMGTVAASLSPTHSVVLNDAMAFASVVAQARFGAEADVDIVQALPALERVFRRAQASLAHFAERRIDREERAIGQGAASLAGWIRSAPHVGTSTWYARRGRRASAGEGCLRYQMMQLYYSASYFSNSTSSRT